MSTIAPCHPLQAAPIGPPIGRQSIEPFLIPIRIEVALRWQPNHKKGIHEKIDKAGERQMRLKEYIFKKEMMTAFAFYSLAREFGQVPI